MRISEIARGTLLLAIVLCLALPLAAQDRVAQLSEVAGNVTVTRADGGNVDEAKQVGPRVRSGSVFAGDVVATAADGTATMVFTDGTEVKLKESTKLSVREVDFSALMASGDADKPIGRVIKVMAGDIWTHVVPNPQIATEFETPSGVAAVKGTTLSISVAQDEPTE